MSSIDINVTPQEICTLRKVHSAVSRFRTRLGAPLVTLTQRSTLKPLHCLTNINLSPVPLTLQCLDNAPSATFLTEPTICSPHIGQLKLFLTELHILTDHGDETDTIIYAGAAPGDHLNVLIPMFPNKKWILVDPSPIKLQGQASSLDVTVIQDYCTIELLKNLLKKEHLGKIGFISDIRSSIGGEVPSELVTADMTLQMQLANFLLPQWSLMKFKLLHTETTTKYLGGDLFFQAFSRNNSPEGRLFTTFGKNETLVDYDVTKIINNFNFYNQKIRGTQCLTPSQYIGTDECHDCAYLYHVIEKFVFHNSNGASGPDIYHLLRKVLNFNTRSHEVVYKDAEYSIPLSTDPHIEVVSFFEQLVPNAMDFRSSQTITERLKKLHSGRSFEVDIDDLQIRYKAILTGASSLMFYNVPHAVFSALKDFGIEFEVYGSPIHSVFDKFSSFFPHDNKFSSVCTYDDLPDILPFLSYDAFIMPPFIEEYVRGAIDLITSALNTNQRTVVAILPIWPKFLPLQLLLSSVHLLGKYELLSNSYTFTHPRYNFKEHFSTHDVYVLLLSTKDDCDVDGFKNKVLTPISWAAKSEQPLVQQISRPIPVSSDLYCHQMLPGRGSYLPYTFTEQLGLAPVSELVISTQPGSMTFAKLVVSHENLRSNVDDLRYKVDMYECNWTNCHINNTYKIGSPEDGDVQAIILVSTTISDLVYVVQFVLYSNGMMSYVKDGRLVYASFKNVRLGFVAMIPPQQFVHLYSIPPKWDVLYTVETLKYEQYDNRYRNAIISPKNSVDAHRLPSLERDIELKHQDLLCNVSQGVWTNYCAAGPELTKKHMSHHGTLISYIPQYVIRAMYKPAGRNNSDCGVSVKYISRYRAGKGVCHMCARCGALYTQRLAAVVCNAIHNGISTGEKYSVRSDTRGEYYTTNGCFSAHYTIKPINTCEPQPAPISQPVNRNSRRQQRKTCTKAPLEQSFSQLSVTRDTTRPTSSSRPLPTFEEFIPVDLNSNSSQSTTNHSNNNNNKNNNGNTNRRRDRHVHFSDKPPTVSPPITIAQEKKLVLALDKQLNG